ncbi:MAG: Membrane protein-like protein [Pedosphaera sp.]|nr:Membrane protein-like protein [Pedosphaera sp.]
MSIAANNQEWHYLAGVEVRGPISLEQLSALIAAGTLAETTMIAAKDAPQWRPAAQVLEELRGGNGASSTGTPELDGKRKRGSSLAEDLVYQIGITLNQVAGTEKLEGFSLKEMFSETFQKRSVAEMEDYLIVGTARTTPPIEEVQTGWPKPWLFARFLLFFGVIYFGFVFAYQQFRNPNLIPGLILMGAFAAPIATLILFFELNTPKNISMYRLGVLMSLGGIGSLFIALIGYDVSHLTWLGASSAGIVEELAKLATLILIVRGPRYKYTLNGMLLGAAVGAGFAAFESAGYAFRIGLSLGSQIMMDNIVLRGMLAPLMHVAWTAMVGAALWRVKQDKPITMATLGDPRFYRVLLLAMFLHMFWNSPWEALFYVKEIVLGLAAWFVIWGLVQQGLRQVKEEQQAVAAAGAETKSMIQV